MIDNGQIWCKLSALVMVHIYCKTPTFHLEWVFNPPALTAEFRLNSTCVTRGVEVAPGVELGQGEGQALQVSQPHGPRNRMH